MNYVCESPHLTDYLSELPEVNYNHPAIQHKVADLFEYQMTEIDIAQKAYEFVRDEIAHSMDIQSAKITRTASETLIHREGICYAKSNLLAALLRAKNIPTGFCYQRLTLGDTPATGYSIHALNAIYLATLKKWIRLDARGNKPGIRAEFSIKKEKLAFSIRKEFQENNYPLIYAKPHRKTMEALLRNTNCEQMCLHDLPTEL